MKYLEICGEQLTGALKCDTRSHYSNLLEQIHYKSSSFPPDSLRCSENTSRSLEGTTSTCRMFTLNSWWRYKQRHKYQWQSAARRAKPSLAAALKVTHLSFCCTPSDFSLTLLIHWRFFLSPSVGSRLRDQFVSLKDPLYPTGDELFTFTSLQSIASVPAGDISESLLVGSWGILWIRPEQKTEVRRETKYLEIKIYQLKWIDPQVSSQTELMSQTAGFI